MDNLSEQKASETKSVHHHQDEIPIIAAKNRVHHINHHLDSSSSTRVTKHTLARTLKKKHIPIPCTRCLCRHHHPSFTICTYHYNLSLSILHFMGNTVPSSYFSYRRECSVISAFSIDTYFLFPTCLLVYLTRHLQKSSETCGIRSCHHTKINSVVFGAVIS